MKIILILAALFLIAGIGSAIVQVEGSTQKFEPKIISDLVVKLRARAESKDPEILKQELFETHKYFSVAGIKHKQSDIVIDFRDMVLSDHIWLSDGPKYKNKSTLYTGVKKSEETKISREDEYRYRLRGVPALNVINKWDIDKTIYITTRIQDGVLYKEKPEIKKIAEDTIRSLIPVITEIAGLKLKLVSDMSKEDRQSLDIKSKPIIEFIFYRTLGWHHNGFKTTRFPSQNKHDVYRNNETSYDGAVRLTPDTRAQVEGYYLPSAKNVIERGVCQLGKYRERNPDLASALITECMFRILGLPDVSGIKAASALGQWNQPNDKFSYRWVFDGDDAFEAENKLKGLALDHLPLKISDYDKFVLCLLYNPKLKSGMSRSVTSSVVVDLLNSNPKICSGEKK